MRKEIGDIMSIQSLQKKFIRCSKLLKYYGVKTTAAHFFAQQFEMKFSNFRNELFLEFILKLRKEFQIDDSTDGKKEDNTELPKIIWTMWQQGEEKKA